MPDSSLPFSVVLAQYSVETMTWLPSPCIYGIKLV